MKVNFRTGVYIGAVIGLLLGLSGFYYAQNMMNKAENVATIDLTQFHYQQLDGKTVQLADFEGKNVLINFWATWCGPCIGEFPLLNQVYENIKEDYVFLMVSYEDIDKIAEFSQRVNYQFSFLKSDNFIVEGISTLPQTFVLDKSGQTIYHHPTIFEGNAESIESTLRRIIE